MIELLACMLWGYTMPELAMADLGTIGYYNIIGQENNLGETIGNYKQTYWLICSKSMRPTFTCNDTLILQRSNDIKAGDIIMFKANWSEYYVLHRVIEKTEKGYVTKGDAIARNDPFVKKRDVKFKVIGKLTESYIN